ncbi:hypothetical protein K2X33_10345 [bacterium]|nr:hypothetical protein [bacterium]
METNTQAPATAVSATASAELPLSNNAMAALGYFFPPVAIAALVIKQYEGEASVRFHAVQSLVFAASTCVASFVLGTMMAIAMSLVSVVIGALNLWVIAAVVFRMASALSMLYGLGILAIWITLIVAASQGKQLELPFLGKIAKRIGQR